MAVVDAVDRPPVLRVGTEAEVLWRMVDRYRATLLLKCVGLEAGDLVRRSVPPSSLTLLGLVRHVTEVELYWFDHLFLGLDVEAPYSSEERPEADLLDVTSEPAGDAVARFLARCEASRAIARTHGLDEVAKRQRDGEDVTLRYIGVHLVDEYARHAGHADLLREAIDGVTGS